MKYYVLKNASNANGWDMFPAGETINYTLNSDSLSIPREMEIGSMVIGYQSAPKDRFYSLFKVVNVSNNILHFEKEFEVNGGISITDVRVEVRDLIESDYSGIFEIARTDFESICESMFVYASTDFVGIPFNINNVHKENKVGKNSIIRLSNKFRPYIAAIKSKPFLLLAGISGTGKSRIVRELARSCWEEGSEEFEAQKPINFEMVQVKPNWHDSAELIGYVSRIGVDKEGTPKPVFVAGDFLQFVAKAWENPDVPYFLCLDEMNLAPVEQYFAEYLSVVESRKADEEGNITTDPILKKCGEQWYFDLTAQLTSDDDIRKRFNKEGITLPQNLIVVGTVNMDETTFSFSRKVLDRAMTIEMNEVDLASNLDSRYERIGKLGAAELIGTAVEGVDVYSSYKGVCDTAIAYLQQINNVLEGTPFKIAYRTRNEVLLYVVNNLPYKQEGETEDYVINRALDEITNMKILSRIEGDADKIGNLLERLTTVIKELLGEQFTIENSVSLKKLDEMERKLKSGYTSFWS